MRLRKLGYIFLVLFCVSGSMQPMALYLYQSDREYRPDDISELNWFELCLLRNEVYARYGYSFDTPWLREYFMGQDWYQIATGVKEVGDINSGLTPRERDTISGFITASEHLGKTINLCWNVEDYSYHNYEYYKGVNSIAVPYIVLPAKVDSYYFGENAIRIWSKPEIQPGGLLPKKDFSEVFERDDTEIDNLWNTSTHGFENALDDAYKLLDTYNTEDVIYRVYNRNDGTISAVEGLMLGAGDSSLQLKPNVLWRAWFDKRGAIRLYRPVNEGGGWTSIVFIAGFNGPPDETNLRCLIYGDISSIDMEVVKGPYSELPFTVNLYDVDRDGVDRYTQLTSNEE